MIWLIYLFLILSPIFITIQYFDVQGKIYASGGFGVSKSILSTMECYDPATNKWSKMPAMKKMCGFVGGTLIDRPIHLDNAEYRILQNSLKMMF